ncbi:MAG: alpha-mannosidase [Thermosipho sp. (in: Bacteria)]|nr:alpha-mannosidase [Thermosipho sp. (in: thermotogales)]
MDRKLDLEIRHLDRLIGEFIPYSIKSKTPILNWKYFNSSISFPFKWDDKKTPAKFETKIKLPNSKTLYLLAWFGGESLVKVDDKPYGEINIYHKTVNLKPFCDGKVHKLTIETVPRSLFGRKAEPIFKEAYLIEFDKEIKEFIIYTQKVIELIKETRNDPLRKRLIEITNEFLYSIKNSHSTGHFITKVRENPSIQYDISTTWSTHNFPTSYEIPENLKKEILEKFKLFKEKIEKLNKIFPKIGKVYIVGHAHIDYAWLWPLSETKRKIVRTFANAVQLAKRYPYFIYTQSSAQMYEDIEKEAPEIFEEIKKLVKSGQWEPIGGMWVESDCNIPSVESLIRQFYYGQKYFEKKFGKKSKVCWLPDVFGFSWVLPQILKESGIDYFITTKLVWNEANQFPYDLCIWKGIDGSKIIYHSFNNIEEGYNGKVSPKTIYSTWNNFKQKEHSSFTMVSIGYGDGGGGPTEEMCESYPILQKLPDMPDIEFSKVEDICSKLTKEISNTQLPIWDGELYLELHRGTLTSQAKIKRLHKMAEESLREAEIINAFFDLKKQEDIDNLWKKNLAIEFHDILPGSSIKEVYEEATKILKEVISNSNKIIKSAKLSNSDNYLTIFNPSSFKQKIKFELNTPLTLEINNQKLNVVKTYNGKYLYFLNKEIDSLDFITIKITGKLQHINESKIENKNSELENKHIKVHIFNDGTINIFYKKSKKWLFKEKGNILMIYKDIPYFWENWDIDVHYTKSGEQIKAKSIKLVESNPFRKVIEVSYKYEETSIIQYYILWNDSDILEIKTNVDWHHRRSLLRVLFPTNILSRYAKVDIDGGYITRPTHQNSNFEKARFEVMAQRWVNISQYNFGVSILNDGKYGHNVIDSTIGMSLIKAGIYPDFFSDEGFHEFSYAIKPNEKEDVIDIIKEADKFNKSLKVLYGKPVKHLPKITLSEENFKILSFREVNGKFILRIVEVAGGSGILSVSFKNFKPLKVYLTNNLEEIKQEIECKNDSFNIEYNPFKIYTFLIESI